jgi:uncharacterized Zn finger protein
VAKTHWKAICEDCGGAIDSLVELLQGRLSKGVMERICRESYGLFPTPGEIRLACSCPDWAGMCKHVAAVLYGVGARFDHQPELLFRLRGVDEKELIVKAGQAIPLGGRTPASGRVLGGEELADIFGLDMAPEAGSEDKIPAGKATRGKGVKKAGTAKKAVSAKRKTVTQRKNKNSPGGKKRGSA